MILLARAISLDDQKQPDAAEKVLRQLLAEDPRCGLAHIQLIQIYWDAKARTNELAAAVHEFVRQCPDICDAHLAKCVAPRQVSMTWPDEAGVA